MIIYTELHESQFEELVIEFCVELLGYGVQGFVTGMDGGRDARFCGKAQLFPSQADPWEGTIVIQAKHTELYNKSFAEADFSGESSSVLCEEAIRVKALLSRGELDYYLLVSNRRLSGVADEEIRRFFSDNTGLASDRMRFVDQSELDRLCKRFPQAVARTDLNPAKSPPQIDPTLLSEVITRLAKYKGQVNELMEGEVPPPEKRISPEVKNKLNGLRDEYFKKTIRRYVVDFATIRKFLSHPDSQPYVHMYDEIADELQAKLVAWSDDSVPYERCLEQLIANLMRNDFDLRTNRKLTRTLIFYMYCNCDIGGEE